jgi:acyl carrier protein
MDESVTLEAVRGRVAAVVMQCLGTVEDSLTENGLIDSVKAINLALNLEEEFGISLEDVSLADMTTVLKLSQKIYSIMCNQVELRS